MAQLHMSMQGGRGVNNGKEHPQWVCVCTVRPTLSVGGVARVHIEGLLALSDGSCQRKVRLHHPFLVVAVDNRVRWHGQRVTLGHVLGQGGEGLLGLKDGDKQKQSET